MNFTTYPKVPSPQQFEKDSSISFALRKDDIVLTHSDWLLSRFSIRSADGFDAMADGFWRISS